MDKRGLLLGGSCFALLGGKGGSGWERMGVDEQSRERVEEGECGAGRAMEGKMRVDGMYKCK